VSFYLGTVLEAQLVELTIDRLTCLLLFLFSVSAFSKLKGDTVNITDITESWIYISNYVLFINLDTSISELEAIWFPY
jgi:hypothetical protein